MPTTNQLHSTNELVNADVPRGDEPVSRGLYNHGVASISDRLDQIIEQLGIGERELARRAGLASSSHMGLIRKRLREEPGAILLGTLEKIARGAGVSVAWLVAGDDAGPQPDPSPARTAAARVARSRGVWEEAIRSVLAEAVGEADSTRTAIWWLSRMMMREEELIDEALRRRQARTAPEPSFFPSEEEEERNPPSESGEGRIKRKVRRPAATGTRR